MTRQNKSAGIESAPIPQIALPMSKTRNSGTCSFSHLIIMKRGLKVGKGTHMAISVYHCHDTAPSQFPWVAAKINVLPSVNTLDLNPAK